MVNLHPFACGGFFKESFDLAQTGTWVQALKHPTFYVPAFNVLMLIPLGCICAIISSVVLRKRSSWQPSLLSLFELDPVRSLLCIRPYRLADVDDIISKILPVVEWAICLGWFLVCYCRHETKLTSILPSRNESIWFSMGLPSWSTL